MEIDPPSPPVETDQMVSILDGQFLVGCLPVF